MKMRYIAASCGFVYIGALIVALMGNGILANRIAVVACLVALPAVWIGFKRQFHRFPNQLHAARNAQLALTGWLFLAVSVHTYAAFMVAGNRDSSVWAILPSLALLSIALLVANNNAGK